MAKVDDENCKGMVGTSRNKWLRFYLPRLRKKIWGNFISFSVTYSTSFVTEMTKANVRGEGGFKRVMKGHETKLVVINDSTAVENSFEECESDGTSVRI